MKLKYKHHAQLPGFLGSRPDDKKVEDKAAVPTKFDSLRAQCRAKGECYKCGEKYTPGHKCPPQVQLHVVEEMLDALQLSDSTQDSDGDHPSGSDQDNCMKLSVHAVSGTTSKRSMRLQGQVGKYTTLILIDSGSSSNFISQALADKLQFPTQDMPPARVTVAGGGQLTCNKCIPSLTWYTQGHKFTTDLKILPLSSYDIILGMDWLENQNQGRMWVDWKKKTMRFKHEGQRITLRGVRSNLNSCTSISAKALQGMIQVGEVCNVIELCPMSEVPTPYKEIPQPVQAVLNVYPHIFDEPKSLPPHRKFDHHIPLLAGTKPVNVKPYHYTPLQKTEIEAQVTDMLQRGVIQDSTSPFASPVLLVKKKAGTWRFCVDYRHLNNITLKNKYPMPIVDELLDELAGSTWFTKIDMRAGYHQIRLVPDDEHKTAFKTHRGLYEFRVMPFELTNAPTTFQAAMNTIFAPLIRKCVLVFMDDVLIYSSTLEEHVQHLHQVFELLHQHQLFAKRSKCSFAEQQVEYLGHIISAQGVATDPNKIKAVQDWPTPCNVKQVRGFLGLTGYYRKFIQGYSLISRVLSDLLKKDKLFQWTFKEQEAFNHLKQRMLEAPVLALPNSKLPFTVKTDASKRGVGAVLMQQGHPLAYLSKALGPTAQTMSTYEKECLAILLAVDKWRAYLQHAPFTIVTDHRSLIHLADQKLTSEMQQKAFVKLMGLQYKLVYRKGKDNTAADALSRHPVENELFAISLCRPRWLETIVEGYIVDDQAKTLLQELSIHSPNPRGYSLHQGLIRYKDRIWLGNNVDAHKAILLSLHDSGVGGHSGFLATYHRIKSLFAWPKMKQDIRRYVQQYTVCQQAKSEHVKLPGLLDPLPIPTEAWSIISLDFVEGLPKSGSFDCILVVIDKFSKYGHFIPLSHPYTALTIAQKFMDNVYRLHGLPSVIISDRDPIFTSNVWQQLFRLSDTKMNMSSANHPQTDGQTEKLNQCLETFLRCAVHASLKKWAQWLPLAEYWYNTNFHSALGKTPFEILYGYKPRHLGVCNLQSSTSSDLAGWLQEREQTVVLLQHLMRAQQRMKSQEDKQRTECEFVVGDMVYMKLQPYAQMTVAKRSNHKLSFKFFGPYEILARVGKVAYKLKLPAGSQIHPVLHVSQLKKSVPPAQVAASDLSLCFITDDYSLLQPCELVGNRSIQRGRHFVYQVRVRWEGLPSSLQTWESQAALHCRFLHAPAWGQAVSDGEGSATVPRAGRRRRRDIRRALDRRMTTEQNGPVHE